MATQDESGQRAFEVSRRDFLKVAAATAAAAGCGLEFAYDPEKAAAYEDNPDYTISTTTCPYCSASCGQRVVTDASGNVIDIYGDFESPFNSGGLCAKGAGSLQLVNNPRRIGAWADPHPVNPVFEADTTTFPDGAAYVRTGNGDWSAVDLQAAMDDIADRMIAARDANGAFSAPNWNSKQVAFFGSSHLNNEPCYLFRKLVANFGTSNTEHQARI